MRGLKKKGYVWCRVNPRPETYRQKMYWLQKRWSLLWLNIKDHVFTLNCAQESGGALVCNVQGWERGQGCTFLHVSAQPR
eukprot:11319803-Alexandrium_andersonii.AAC.1